MNTKITKFTRFINQNENKRISSSKSKLSNKKNNNKDMAHEKQKFNKI
jgi:hypothetical protein